MQHFRRQRRAFTLVEIMISLVLILIVGLSILTVHTMVRGAQRFERERIVMLSRASQKVESLKSMYFANIAASVESVLVDVNNTPLTTADDITAQLQVRLWAKNGNEITSTAQSTNNNDAVLVNIAIRWTSKSKQHEQEIWTIVTPI